jgi:hypothetical protein
MVDISGFFEFILLLVLVVLLSAGLARLFAQVVPFRLCYLVVRLPGVVLHEIAHVAGCVLAGAEIKKVRLFSETGGSVTYGEPKIPVFGNVIISTAPLLILPGVLALLTWVAGTYLGCYVPPVFPSELGTAAGFYGMITEVLFIFSANLVTRFNGWFPVYLYLAGSITLSLAPSRQDLLNAAAGMVLVTALCLLVIWGGSEGAVTLISLILIPMNTALSIGLMYEVITAFLSLPFIVLHGIMSR